MFEFLANSFVSFSSEYGRLLIFLLISGFFGCIFYFLNILFSRTHITPQKVSPYECGFAAFSDARGSYGVNFYVVGLLFMLFDVELILLFPWIFALSWLSTSARLIMYIFLSILALGYLYERQQGAFEWIVDPF